ncbi:Uncharacterized protein dnl_30620 [Desulfonema limicola]|uniref:Uncharacterized protein n=1 Tax=Desulfonema limicola TaxID=45656 RepID=A0A975B859_9BACT|nr:Uncharacterized protein dnl_30620 [Desulfonema limicola]
MFSWKYNCEVEIFCLGRPGNQFQSLFSWKYNCEETDRTLTESALLVSILVFMEVQL